MPVDETKYLNIDWLRETGAEPSWFGLGFIQLKLNSVERMHFWHPSLTPDVTEEEIHDHRYNFTSTILKGEMHHETWNFIPSAFGSWVMCEVSCDPAEPVVDPRQITGGAVLTGTYWFREGSRYMFPKGEFHRTKTEQCVSLLRREEPEAPFARVIRRKHDPEICPFSNPKDPEYLWGVIAELLEAPSPPAPKLPGYHLKTIQKGELGEPSKIREELEEFLDATDQKVSIMALVELADMVGSVEAYLAKHHPSIGLDDLKAMSDVTKRAFINGRRS